MKSKYLLFIVSVLVISLLTGCGGPFMQQTGGIAFLWKMFDDHGNSSVAGLSAPSKAIGVNGVVVFKQSNPAPFRGVPAYNLLTIEFYKEESDTTPDTVITLNSDYYFVANNLGFHPAKTLVKNGSTIIGTVKNKVQDLSGDIKKLEIRQKIVIDLINNKTECTAMKIFQKEKSIERQFLTGTPLTGMENDMNVVPVKGIIELASNITDCSVADIDKINEFLNSEFIEIVVKRGKADIENCINKHLTQFGRIDNINDLNETTMKNNVSDVPAGDISDELAGNLDSIMEKIESINKKIEDKNTVLITNSGNRIYIENSENIDTFTVKMLKNDKSYNITLQITDGILFMDQKTENAGISCIKGEDNKYRFEFTDLSDGIYDITVFIEGNVSQSQINYINNLPEEFPVNKAVLIDENITLAGNVKLKITWTDSVDLVDHYEILGKVGEVPSSNDVIVTDIPVGTQEKEFEYLAGGKVNIAVAAVTAQGTKRICQATEPEVGLNVKVSFPDEEMEKLVRYYGDFPETGDIYIDDCLEIEFFSTIKWPENSYPIMERLASFDEGTNSTFKYLSRYINESIDGSTLFVDVKDITGINYLRNVKELYLFDVSMLGMMLSPGKISSEVIKRAALLRMAEPDPLKGLDGVSALKNLESFITMFFLEPFDMNLISSKEKLKNIGFMATKMENIDFSIEFPNLEFAIYYNMELFESRFLTDATNFIDSLAGHNNLKKVAIFSDLSDIINLEKIALMPNLESLMINFSKLTDISFVENMTSLKFISFEHNEITDIASLKNLNLDILSLHENNVTDFSTLVENQYLEDSNTITFIDANKIAGSVSLDDLTTYIGRRPMGIDYYTYIAGLK